MNQIKVLSIPLLLEEVYNLWKKINFFPWLKILLPSFLFLNSVQREVITLSIKREEFIMTTRLIFPFPLPVFISLFCPRLCITANLLRVNLKTTFIKWILKTTTASFFFMCERIVYLWVKKYSGYFHNWQLHSLISSNFHACYRSGQREYHLTMSISFTRNMWQIILGYMVPVGTNEPWPNEWFFYHIVASYLTTLVRDPY